jgi:geranylgeranyl diphosphate synthase type II
LEKLNEYLQFIEEELSKLNINGKPSELYEPIKYTLSLGGKRIRPVLTLISCEAFGGSKDQALNAALAIEVFHNFTLLHDDIMDNAPLRRTKETVHVKWNPNIAILSGDAMFVLSQQLLLKSETDSLIKCLILFNKTAIEVCEGQQLDMNFEKQEYVSIPSYINMIGLKTAVLLACSLKIGALIAGSNDEDAQHIYNYGYNLGVAFQLQDDILDVYADPNKFGKQVGGDIISNKKTFLLLKAMELSKLNHYKESELKMWMQAGQEHAKEKVEAVTLLYDFLGVKEIALKEVDKYHHVALTSLDKINLNENQKKVFYDFAHFLMKRDL